MRAVRGKREFTVDSGEVPVRLAAQAEMIDAGCFETSVQGTGLRPRGFSPSHAFSRCQGRRLGVPAKAYTFAPGRTAG
jgi:hypothetical protein